MDPRAGGPNLAAWLNLGSIVPPFLGQLNVIVPTMEMQRFQRRIRHQHIQTPTLVNQRALTRATVPDDEAWLLRAVTVIHTDTGNKFFTIRIVSGLNVNLVAQYTIGQVPANSQRLALFPGSSSEVAAERNSVKSGPVPEAYPRDQVHIDDLTATVAAGGAQIDVILSYELIPLPSENQLSQEFVGTAV